MQPLVQWKKNKYYIFWVCDYSRMRRILVCDLFCSTIYSPYYVTNGTIFTRKLRDIKYVLIFSTNLSQKLFIVRKLSEIWLQTYVGLHVKYRLFLSGFNENWIYWKYFRKILKYQIPWKSVQWEPRCSLRMDRRICRLTKKIVAFLVVTTHCGCIFTAQMRALASSFPRFLDHTKRRATIGRTPLDEWSIRRRDLYLTTHNTHNTQTSMPPVRFEHKISAGERPKTRALDRVATGTGKINDYQEYFLGC